MRFMLPSDWLIDKDKSIEEQLFTLISGTVMVFILVYALLGIPLGTNITSIIALLVGDALMLAATLLSLKYKKYQLGSTFITVLIGFVLMPINFFCSGGPFGGTLLWFVATLLYIDIVLMGRPKWVFFLLSLSMTLACCYISLFHPDILPPVSVDHATQTNTLAMLMMGFLLNSIVIAGVRAYQYENQRSLEQANEIAKLSAAQNRFFSSMSHEIRTPVNTIIGLNEMILRESDSPEIVEDAQNVQAAGKMLLQTINDILDMSKFESGQMQLSPAAYKTGDMLSEVVGMLWLRAQEKGLEFRVDVLPDLPEELYGDEMRIRQVLVNVLNNAIKYTNEGSVTLQIQWQRIADDTANVVYTVSDTGIGIKKESIPYLFTAFRREEREESQYVEGTGLGLSIVKNLVDLMGGTITVNSIYTKGSTFIIEIPQTIVSSGPVGEIRAGRRREGGAHGDYHQSFEAPEAKVLVVDDAVANLMVVRKLLRDTKVQVTTVESGREALEKTQETSFDVIFMDHLMPEMDGVACLHQIREQSGGLCREAHIIALTANVGGDVKTMYAREGFDGYLAKPVNGKELERELQYALPPEMVRVVGEDVTLAMESTAFISEHQKKQPIIITTESVSDLPASLLRKLDVAVIPHRVSTAEGIFRDGIEISTRGLLEYMGDGGLVGVREPDVSEYEEFFADVLLRANNIIHVSITSGVQLGGCANAVKAAKSFENIFVVNSGHLSSGQGLMVLEACQMAEEEKSVQEILAALDAMREKVSTSFIVESLQSLVHNGQVGPTLALVTGALMIHPVVSLRKGRMVVRKVCFGSKEAVWKQYVKSALATPSAIDKSTLFITHAGLSHAELEMIRGMVAQRVAFEKVYVQEAVPSIAANCGPGTFGLLFVKA